ncbi:MAG: hypothetical protein ACE5HB_02855, partial [Terriglobia bacterium]
MRLPPTKRLTSSLLLLGLLLAVPASALAAPAPAEDGRHPVVGRLLTPEGARVVVRREPCRCDPGPDGAADVVLLTLGTENKLDGQAHFHPLASLAFDRSLSEGKSGHWMALWSYGPSPAGWRRTLRALLPLPVGAPRASGKDLERLDRRLQAILSSPEQSALLVPDPLIDLPQLGHASTSQGVLGGLKRGLGWAGVFNPAQFLYRAYLTRRKDRRERTFQRAYLAVQWLLDVSYSGETDSAWLATMNDLRFHLLRDRSLFGRLISHADALDVVYGYESVVRIQLGKTSSWLQSAANEHHLRYQPIYRYTHGGAASPVGGVLYYDPRLGTEPDPGWWEIANPFDLPYNPHTHPKVQRLAAEHPEELIPLAVYTFQTDLALRPIITIDFFSSGNPHQRESTQQTMTLLKQWLAITTGTLSPARVPYAAVSWAANKKGYTLLVDKSSRLGIEELRLALESELYFNPEQRQQLLERADQRVLNPLIKAAPVEERLAHIQHESLLALDARGLCRRVAKVRREMGKRLEVPRGLSAQQQRRDLARRLVAWHQQRRLKDFVARPPQDTGSLGSLRAPLEYFLDEEPVNRKKLEELLVALYAKLHRQHLELPGGRTLPELENTLALTRQAWRRVASATDVASFRARVERLEEKQRAKEARAQRELEKKRLEVLREFLKETRKRIEQARRAGCRPQAASPAELEA